MEENILEQNPVTEEEFNTKIHDIAEHNKNKVLEDLNEGIIYLRDFNGVKKFKSIRRAIRRGNVSVFGDSYPKRPFNNRKRNKENDVTCRKRKIYEQLTKKKIG